MAAEIERVQSSQRTKEGLINRCGLAMLHKLAGVNPVQVISSHEPGIEPCRHLSGLCEQKVADRYQKRVQRWTREAGLPPGKSFANLKLEEFSASEQQLIIAQKDHSDWAHHAGNVLLIGPSGGW